MFELLSKVTPESKLISIFCTNSIYSGLLKYWLQHSPNAYYIVLNKIVYIAK